MKYAINGYGRIGRLVYRALREISELECGLINDPHLTREAAMHLTEFDTVHGRWSEDWSNWDDIEFSSNEKLEQTDWSAVDIVLECSGAFRTVESLQPYFDAGVKKVIVSAPVKAGALNIVVGCNDHLYDPAAHHLLTAASCTTNCVAPVVKVLHESIGIKHGMLTTLHNLTNTQRIVDAPHRDLRRARSAVNSLIPTSTGSATAIGLIFPELEGRLDGVAVRVPLLNASLTDCVFEMERPVTVEEVNTVLRDAAEDGLEGILGVEDKPLVSADYTNDSRSGIVDTLSTRVTNETQVKVLVWYDNEWGYSMRMAELLVAVAKQL